ncbi:MAG TPA: DUF2273 domain-containing protein [Firmicutes bacterium]|jgi:hypothetical protein|nr:DUF2273 domain-containing protein [Bacillota bacterium]HOQ23198.1 DUF2273 domain-containing protein [Bacillota bacterium]HPT66627.1 DUF2273 domain-containing protein [Bacillota bacterium]
MDEKIWERIKVLVDYKGRILGGILGFITGLIVVKYGWINALYFLFCLGAGYYIGKLIDGKASFRQILEKVLPSGD